MGADDRNDNSGVWELKGHYPGRFFSGKDYHFDTKFTENNINQMSIKILNGTLENTVLCSFADYVTSGEVIAVWSPKETGGESSHLQQHDGFELMYIVKGPCSGIMEYAPFTLNSGDCLLLNSNIRNMYDFQPDTLMIGISITLQFIQKHFMEGSRLRLLPDLFQDFFVRSLESGSEKQKDYIRFSYTGNDVQNSSVHLVIQNMYMELRKKAPGFDSMIDGLLIRLFHNLTRKEDYRIGRAEQSTPSREELVDEIKKYLDKNKHKVTMQELSERFHYNGTYLGRVFQKEIGQTIRNYNTAVCMQEALRLLQKTDLPVVKISEQIGFASRAQFYKLFEQRYGKKPSDYRTSGSV